MKKLVFFIAVVILIVLIPTLSKQRSAKIFFVGDMSFDRYIRQTIDAKGEDFIFSCLGETLKKADLVVGNLEGPITENPSVSLGSEIGSPDNFVFTFPPETTNLLARQNIKLVNLGNNHIDDFGKAGLLSTINYLEKSGVDYFGGFGGEEPIFKTKLAGKNISFISYNQFGGNSPEKVAEKIKEENKMGQLVIVYTHWGEEYSSPTNHMKETSRLFAQSGARAVIGSHPHVILPSETVGDTLVYYSLGNFIFDQYWNSEVSTGLLLELNFKGDSLEALEHKITLGRDGRTCLVEK